MKWVLLSLCHFWEKLCWEQPRRALCSTGALWFPSHRWREPGAGCQNFSKRQGQKSAGAERPDLVCSKSPLLFLNFLPDVLNQLTGRCLQRCDPAETGKAGICLKCRLFYFFFQLPFFNFFHASLSRRKEVPAGWLPLIASKKKKQQKNNKTTHTHKKKQKTSDR